MTKEQFWAKTLLSLAERKKGIMVNGIRLAAGERDRALFSQGLILLRETEDLLPDEAGKTAFRASPQIITDAEGTLHTLSVTDLRAMLVAYGTAYQTLWNAANSND